MSEQSQQLVTKAEALERGGFSRGTLARRIAAGEIRTFTDGRDRRRRLIALEDVERVTQPIPIGRSLNEPAGTAA